MRQGRAIIARSSAVVFTGLLYVIVSAVVLQVFLTQWGFLEGSPRASFESMLSGTAQRPFAFRVLTPALTNALAPLVPARVMEKVERVESPRHDNFLVPPQSARARFMWPHPTAAHYVTYGLLFLALMGVLVVGRRLVRNIPNASRAFIDLAPAIGLLLLPLTFARGGYIYDFPELFLVTGCLALLLERRWFLYYVCFALACLNKEADVLLVIYFVAVVWKRSPLRQTALHVGLHVLIGGAILTWQRLHFASNPGLGMYQHLWSNLAFFASGRPLLSFAAYYAPLIPVPTPYNVIGLFLFAVLVVGDWRNKPAELRRCLMGMMAVLIPLMLVSGSRDEVRNLSLAFPVIFVLGCYGFLQVYAVSRPGGSTGLPVADRE